MKKFTLLINGEDFDTKIYEYFPYIDKQITDFKTTFRILTGIKTGRIPEEAKEADEYIYAKYCIGKDDTNLKAMESAYRAFKEFRKFPLSVRKNILLDIHKSLLGYKEEFLKLLMIEGHPKKLGEWEFEGMRVGSSPETTNYYYSMVQKEIGKYSNEILYNARRPDGVVCISPPRSAAASNSFNAILVYLTGNALIVKPPLKTPISTIFLWKEVINKVLEKYQTPPGLLNIVIGNSKRLMDEWLDSRYINDIILFGDSKKGIEEGARIYIANKKPILELSGNDFQLVWKDADLEKAAESLIDGFLGSTQVCMMPKIALIHKDVFDEFKNKFTKKVKNLKVGLPSDVDTLLSPVSKIEEFFMFLKDALSKGANLICGGKRIDYSGKPDEKGSYIEPTLIEIDDIDKAKSMLCINEEIFFPLLPLVQVTGSDEEIFDKMVEAVNVHNYGLRTSLWIKSGKFMRKFAKELDNCGILRINLRHAGFSYYISTHGGTRRSGGPYGEMNYFWQKTSHLQGISRALQG
ncbi:MAG: aldehyde dehydrogenase [Candidatus Omnitrophota bacterium]|nr:aldehyde dehydrogenase [Candidatus Omnitrophota bacterium]